MSSSYEIATRKIVPIVRSALVAELKTKYNKTEQEIARILGITQAAISKRINKTIEAPLKNEELVIDKKIIEDYTKKIVEGTETAQRCICSICNSINDFGCKFSSVKNDN